MASEAATSSVLRLVAWIPAGSADIAAHPSYRSLLLPARVPDQAATIWISNRRARRRSPDNRPQSLGSRRLALQQRQDTAQPAEGLRSWRGLLSAHGQGQQEVYWTFEPVKIDK